MKKYVINRCYGGFTLSQDAFKWLMENKGWKCATPTKDFYIDTTKTYLSLGFRIYSSENLPMGRLPGYGVLHALEETSSLSFRSDPDVIECVETLGENAEGPFSEFQIIECDHPENDLMIDEYDGLETLQTIPKVFG